MKTDCIVSAIPKEWVIAAKVVVRRTRTKSERHVIRIGQWARVRTDLGAILQFGITEAKRQKESKEKDDSDRKEMRHNGSGGSRGSV
jgi:hypothetical protein